MSESPVPSTINIDQEYYDKLEEYYSEADTNDIITRITDYSKKYCGKNMIMNDNVKSIVITYINDLYRDNMTNSKSNIPIIEINDLDTYLELTPQERCPKLWENIIKKIEFIEEKKNNIYTTDIYECRRCHKRKCTIEIIQTRSADEPATTFVNCIVCGNHWAT